MSVLDPAVSTPRALPAVTRLPRWAAVPVTGQWGAMVMGTGILAGAFTLSPVVSAPVATGAWLLAAALLLVLAAAALRQLRRGVRPFLAAVTAPANLPFLGAVAMAVLTVGNGALLAGTPVLGEASAQNLALAAWVLGTAVGLGTLLIVPLVLVRVHRLRPEQVTGAHLMPVVPPMVSAAGTVTLTSHGVLSPGALPWIGGTLAALSALAAFPLLVLIACRRVAGPAVPVQASPSLVIPLGVLGQSTTAVLGMTAGAGGPWAAWGEHYAIIVLLLAAVWAVVAAERLVRAWRDGLAGSLGWWAFTFPVGTCVTGSGVLATATGSTVAAVGSVVALVVLVAGWCAAATATLAGLARPAASLHPSAARAVDR